MDNTSPLTASSSIPLPPMPQRGTRDPAPSSGDFRAMLEMEGVRPPKTAAEAQITAAQIASKANVNAGVKRDHVWTGMDTTAPAAPAVASDRFMPLRQGPGAARTFSSSPSGSANTVEALRATTKFAPGPVVNPNLKQAVPAVAETIKRTAGNAEPVKAAAPKAVEAYAFGLRAASENKPSDVPPWFDGAVQNALDKYDAMKAQAH